MRGEPSLQSFLRFGKRTVNVAISGCIINILAPAENYTKRYGEYVDQYYEYMRSEEGIYLIKLFDERFPKEKISNVKKLDFILRLDKQND